MLLDCAVLRHGEMARWKGHRCGAPSLSRCELACAIHRGGVVSRWRNRGMSMADIEADYLVIGAAATAMAFVDTLLRETADATVVMVDRGHHPGGHWNDAYPFVRLHQPSIVLEQGTVAATPGTLYVDCSAGAIVQPPDVPVFDGKRINLLMVRTCQPVFSAALIAWVESHVVPSPEPPIDWLRMAAPNFKNGRRWRQHDGLSAWLARCRLNLVAVFMPGVTPGDTDRVRLVERMRAKSARAEERLATLLAASEGKESP